MAKLKTAYACTECGGRSSKWQGQCPHCGAWNTLVETVATPAATRFHAVAGAAGEVRQLSSVDARVDPRWPTG
ncbi:MAG: DNA repair protein RadA, partial [Pseudomonadota bacterium]|nr:DNA repair protein RadA [Pseudomonadota bacterium]